MRKRIVLAIAAASAFAGLSPAAAQTPKIEDVCVQVAKHLLLAETFQTGVVQSFPELKPPGARLTFSTREGVEKKDMVDSIECEFQNTAAPFDLQRFCVSSTCYGPNERNEANKRRFEEVRALLKRDGL
ncbi:hypothetical protein C8J38_101319 [Rhizobium sp. PP-WC-2G-219]|uniref:Uncharacterized protein n=1 Tax=Ferranicluibacter rubi TaxID=2715133 RepID=A0AA43ZB44_9HYPH|nr:hypothetical protein [Ferranicluibacter rubi]NHT74574.1 hypothetical protein [Ferranicluibacter rubi]PYE46862.1 hypothetical protein DFI02_1011012 [Rhizobium sp. PP-F2F-G20b]TCL95968.1 hypothetical protein C8J38_101319 [Rhizobium sp. PP-WC-2G-219]TCP89438.1 hypothetical protein C8J31_102615 [Rhizobium sp. PP-CC-2G-626]